LRLQLDDIRWRPGSREVLSGVSFAVEPGELVALMGRNGAGKSTLLDIIAGLRTPDAGDVRLDDRPLRAWTPPARARLVAHLPQSVRADLPFLAADLVLMGRYPHTDRWYESPADRDAVEQAMRRTHSWELRDRLVSTLSGGERQRVLLAACLAQAPQLLLLDEPSTHLDIDQQLHCFTLLREETARGAACVTVTHDLNLALAYATRVIIIADGRVAFDASTADALRTPDWLPLFSSRLRLSGSWVSYV
jgi:iron complex transport system ATP-binding protein